LAFDAADRLYLVGGSLGLVRRELSGGYRQLTTGWPEFASVTGVSIQGDTAVIATYDSGVLLWSLTTSSARRVTLAPRGY
jgi:hypothetical protein